MSIKIGSNLASLNAQRRLGDASSSLSSIYEKLSSGQRINRASDDAAGLAIADDLNAKGRVYTQVIRNGNDGISLLNIADSAIASLSGIVTGLKELGEQSANGVYSSTQRLALDNEAQALSQEYSRITQSTKFNGINILDGSLTQGLNLQLGYGSQESLTVSVGDGFLEGLILSAGEVIATGNFSATTNFTSDFGESYEIAAGDLNGDGYLDLVTAGKDDFLNGTASISLGLGDGTFGESLSITMDTRESRTLLLTDLNADGYLDLITAGSTDSNSGTASVRLGNGIGGFGSVTTYATETSTSNALALVDLNNDSILDLITAGSQSSFGNPGSISVRLGTGSGNFSASKTNYSSGENRGISALAVGDVDGDGVDDLVTGGSLYYYGYATSSSITIRPGTSNGNFSGSFFAISEPALSQNNLLQLKLADIDGDNNLDIVSSHANSEIKVRFGDGNGNFINGQTIATTIQVSDFDLVDINSDGENDIITSTGQIFTGDGDGTFSTGSSFSSSGFAVLSADFNADNILDIAIAGGTFAPNNGKVYISLAETEDTSATTSAFSLLTQSDSRAALDLFEQKLSDLATQRGIIGASQSRVNIAIANLQAAKENFAAAESRIRDADVASEAANLVRTQILQQAAASVLAQANQAPQLALQLLR